MFLFKEMKQYNCTYENHGQYWIENGIIVVDEKWEKHVQERHAPWSQWDGSKFKADNENEVVLQSGVHLSPTWKHNEYRWGDSQWKYNVTAKKTSNWIFSLITVFPKKKK